MDHLDISRRWFVVTISSIRQVGLRAINNIFPQISSLDQVSYLLLQLETIISVVPMVPIKLTILFLVSFISVSLDLPRPLHKLLILYFHEHLGYGGIKKR